jgi:hypothetical protein
MNAARTLVLGAVAELAAQKPIRERINLYRAAAEFAGSPEDAAPFLRLAGELEAAERRCHEFVFSVQHPPRKKGARR